MSPWLALIIFIIVVLIVWWALTRTAKTHKPDFDVHPHEEIHAVEKAPAPAVPVVEAVVLPTRLAGTVPTEPLRPDDLTILEGIGPKINQLLQGAGIRTFAQLSASEVSELKAILDPAGLQFIDPGTWAEQAKLAAEGKFDELKTLTDSLKGGRRVK
jgi:predicted flap endonuclease-1-like 5' DNA nuclease